VYGAFRDEARRTDRPMRFLVFEWLRTDVKSRVPMFTDWFETENKFYNRFKGYYDYACKMYSLAMNRDSPVSESAMFSRAQVQDQRREAEQAKLDTVLEMVARQQEVVKRLNDPLYSMDQDILSMPTLALPSRAGKVKPAKVIHNRGTKGKDLSEIVSQHSLPMSSDQVARNKSWSSYKRVTWSQREHSNREPYSVPRLCPSLRPTRFRELDERDPALGSGRRPNRVRRMDQEGRVTAPPTPTAPSTSRPYTQDEWEEEDLMEEHWLDGVDLQ